MWFSSVAVAFFVVMAAVLHSKVKKEKLEGRPFFFYSFEQKRMVSLTLFFSSLPVKVVRTVCHQRFLWDTTLFFSLPFFFSFSSNACWFLQHQTFFHRGRRKLGQKETRFNAHTPLGNMPPLFWMVFQKEARTFFLCVSWRRQAAHSPVKQLLK